MVVLTTNLTTAKEEETERITQHVRLWCSPPYPLPLLTVAAATESIDSCDASVLGACDTDGSALGAADVVSVIISRGPVDDS